MDQFWSNCNKTWLICENFVSPDERSKKFFLLENPPTLFAMILISYVLMVKYGPKFMKDRKPFELKAVMMTYNLVQILINGIVSLMVSAINFHFLLSSNNFKCHWKFTLNTLTLKYDVFLHTWFTRVLLKVIENSAQNLNF